MKAVVMRVQEAQVKIEAQEVGAIKQGLLVLLGIAPQDTKEIAVHLAQKICHLRIFADVEGKMNLSLAQIQGQILVVSQFTLFADLSSRRPGFTGAAKPEIAQPLYEAFLKACTQAGFPPQHGQFGADMQVTSVNDGPVTLLFDTETGKAGGA